MYRQPQQRVRESLVCVGTGSLGGKECTTRQPPPRRSASKVDRQTAPGPRFGIPTDLHACSHNRSTPEVVSWHLAALHSRMRHGDRVPATGLHAACNQGKAGLDWPK